jgi:hypothetical protein
MNIQGFRERDCTSQTYRVRNVRIVTANARVLVIGKSTFFTLLASFRDGRAEYQSELGNAFSRARDEWRRESRRQTRQKDDSFREARIANEAKAMAADVVHETGSHLAGSPFGPLLCQLVANPLGETRREQTRHGRSALAWQLAR